MKTRTHRTFVTLVAPPEPRACRLAWRALAALGLALAVAGCGGGEKSAKGSAEADTNAAAQPARLAATDLAVARVADLTAGVPVSGTLTPAIDVNISSPLDEVLERVFVKEGQAVRRGQPLAQFRTSSLAPEAASAAAELKMRATDHTRMQNLLTEGAVSEHDVESAEAEWRAASARDAQAGKKLRDATVLAPVDGVIAKRSVQGGDRVGVGDPLFELVNVAELEFEATVPAEYVRDVKVGAPVALTITGYAGGVEGKVARVNATADPATRQVKVYVRVPNPGGALVGGLFASGALVTQHTAGALAVPAAAVHADGARRWVMSVRGGRLVRGDVTAGLRDDAQDLVAIVAGLAAGDTVVSGPVEGLAAGQNVIVSGRER